ncbi:hypothetical protein [Qipengyuania nanhaisediminis]|uniref:hypothetical protein n=1 Tax=Qipengyuania nanhaisediminis TaxID=604088 RepID=UPI0038B2A3E7
MQALVDFVDSLTGVVRLAILAITGLGVIITLIAASSFSYVAPQVAEDYADRAENNADKAIVAAREEARARSLAEDGWGYDASTTENGSMRDASGEPAGGWGADPR